MFRVAKQRLRMRTFTLLRFHPANMSVSIPECSPSWIEVFACLSADRDAHCSVILTALRSGTRHSLVHRSTPDVLLRLSITPTVPSEFGFPDGAHHDRSIPRNPIICKGTGERLWRPRSLFAWQRIGSSSSRSRSRFPAPPWLCSVDVTRTGLEQSILTLCATLPGTVSSVRS